MSVDTGVQAHHETARLGIHEVARQLNTHLGATLVAAAAGSDRALPAKWAQATGPEPRDDKRQRLVFLHRIWTQLAGSESDHIARAWLTSGNPLLDEDTPLTAIREDRFKETATATAAFLSDLPST